VRISELQETSGVARLLRQHSAELQQLREGAAHERRSMEARLSRMAAKLQRTQQALEEERWQPAAQRAEAGGKIRQDPHESIPPGWHQLFDDAVAELPSPPTAMLRLHHMQNNSTQTDAAAEATVREFSTQTERPEEIVWLTQQILLLSHQVEAARGQSEHLAHQLQACRARSPTTDAAVQTDVSLPLAKISQNTSRDRGNTPLPPLLQQHDADGAHRCTAAQLRLELDKVLQPVLVSSQPVLMPVKKVAMERAAETEHDSANEPRVEAGCIQGTAGPSSRRPMVKPLPCSGTPDSAGMLSARETPFGSPDPMRLPTPVTCSQGSAAGSSDTRLSLPELHVEASLERLKGLFRGPV
jgi:hypothetical protein